MSNYVAITSDTKGKLKKIVEGVVYSDPLVFVTELFQNSYRAKAKIISIEHYNDTLIFSDDGSGLRKPSNLLTLDYSAWDTTDEGYGIGFWSILAIPNLETVVVKSKNWVITINVSEMLRSDIPSATVEECEEFYDGLSVELKSQYIDEHAAIIKNRVYEDGELMEFDVYYNNSIIDKKNLLEEVDGVYTKEFHNRLFDAKFAINNYSFKYPNLYYEKRLVGTFYGGNNYVSGVIEMKKKALNLREPDRRAYTHDEKCDAFSKKINQCVKELYLDFLANTDQKVIDEYADAISEILDVSDYEKFLLVDDEIIIEKSSERDIEFAIEAVSKTVAFKSLVDYVSSLSNKNQLTFFDDSMSDNDKRNVNLLLNKLADEDYVWVNTGIVDNDTSSWAGEVTEDIINNAEVIVIGGIRFEKRLKKAVDLEDYAEDDSESSSEISFTDRKTKIETVKLIDKIKKYRRKVWIKASELDEYAELIAKAEYYKVKVLTAKNMLFENVFLKHNIPHISELKNGLKKTCIKKNVALKTGKEENFISLLHPICQYYKLPYNTFRIANLSVIIETILDEKVIDREVVENRKDDINIYGICEDDIVYLDRRALGLNRFSITCERFGINEFKAVCANLTTIAHELAHLLYGTEDNTVEHYKVSIQLEEEICRLLLTL